ncbi:hypothetical protein [Streptomyces sp. NPDC005408]|uniref:hypothetical protein n=1 Tax=Streptomyces sp. NPDC005408 TaxID=3155341 RepID=UPI0033B58971
MTKKSTLAALTAAACLGLTLAAPAAQAAPRNAWQMQCTDSANSVLVTAQTVGSGASTAKYDVSLSTFDKKNDGHAPYVRLKSLNNRSPIPRCRAANCASPLLGTRTRSVRIG